MALISPGVKVSIIDESQYVPAATNSVPYILLATASNKASGAGVGTAAGTLPANANKTYLLTSQRDLLATFGNPLFYTDTAGNALNGYELNEYGLLAAYSALGVTNRCYVQRADINLQDLTASLVRPHGAPGNGSFWFDLASSVWGVFQWNQVTGAFTNQVPTIFNSTEQLTPSTTIPLDSIGSIGNYGVVTTTTTNPMYFKSGGCAAGSKPAPLTDPPTPMYTPSVVLAALYNTWTLVGSAAWQLSWPTVTGTLIPTSNTLVAGDITINGTNIVLVGTETTYDLCDAINAAAITGIHPAVIGGRLMLFADATANAGAGTIVISQGAGTNLQVLGILAGTYAAPGYLVAPSYQYPRWRATDATPKPTGSIWQKSNAVNQGANLTVKRFNSTLDSFILQACPMYANDQSANATLDPVGGGANIAAGATYAQYYYYADGTSNTELFQRMTTGQTVVTGSSVPTAFTAADTFTILASQPGTSTLNSATVTLTSTTALSFVSDVQAANVPYVSASINAAGQIVFTHSKGGVIYLKKGTGTPIATAGFVANTTVGVKDYYDGTTVAPLAAGVALSAWMSTPIFTYVASVDAPNQDPASGTYWYYSDPTNSSDIMIQDNGQWMGYLNVNNDVRGYNLTITDPNGPICAATTPTEQSTGLPLQLGDLWIDTSDLDNFPVIYRWEGSSASGGQWVLIDNTDQTTENGILFANARWAANGITDPITDPIPSITSLLISNYVDLDAPDPDLYPQGTLLFNLRRSGYNVKKFMVNYFNADTFPIDAWDSATFYAINNTVTYNGVVYIALTANNNKQPNLNTTDWSVMVTSTWTSASANNNNGSPTMGRHSQRAIIVAALKEGIDTSVTAREEQIGFNLLSCPQYPELGINLVALNNERSNTAFIISDTPMRLTPGEIVNWATNSLTNPVDAPLNFASQYAGVWYPSCQTTDLNGSAVVQPPSHMMIRTILRSDSVSYPWMAPAGTRRGVVDNAIQIGYIDAATSEFVSLGVNQGIRDTLYENAVNPITFIPGVGITAYGQKTITSIASALDRINVARLIVFIRTRLEFIGKQYLFEPNDQITRNEFSNAVNSLCVDLVAKRALYDYLIVCDLTNNTPARIDRNELWLDLAIEPVKAVEFIYIPVRIKNTGEIAAGTGGG